MFFGFQFFVAISVTNQILRIECHQPIKTGPIQVWDQSNKHCCLLLRFKITTLFNLTHLHTSSRDSEALHQFLLVLTRKIWPPLVRSFQLPHFNRWESRSLPLLSRWLLGKCRHLIGLAVAIAGGTCVVGIRRWSWTGVIVAVLRTWVLNVDWTSLRKRCWPKKES